MRRALTLTFLLLFAADARAAVTTGGVADPEGDAPAAGVDIVAASWAFDDATGKVSVVVTLKEKPDDVNWGVINASFRTACEGGSEFATIRANSRTAGSGAGTAGNADDGVQPDGSQGAAMMTTTNVKSDDGRTTTAEGSHARLVGRKAGCVRVTLTHHGTLDSVTMPAVETTGEPTPPPPPAPPGTPPPGPPAPAATPQDVELGSGRRLIFRNGKARAGLRGVARGMNVRLSLRLANGTTIAGVLHKAQVTQPALVTLRLTAKGRRHFRRHARGKAQLYVRTSYGQAIFQRQYAVTYRR